MLIRKFILFFVIILLSVLQSFGQKADSLEFFNPVLFSETAFRTHLQFLGSDLFEGRAPGTRGGELSAKYLASTFAELNLTPIGGNGTYYQYIPMHSSKPMKESELFIYLNNNIIKLNVFDDYLLFQSGEQTYTPSPVDLIFAGYGIIAPEFDYNDYQSIDVRGKIVVVLDGEPFSNENPGLVNQQAIAYAHPESKQIIAMSRGASGCIIIPNLNIKKNYSWDHFKKSYAFEDLKLAYSLSSNLCLMINPEKANMLFENSGYSLNDVYEADKLNKIKSFKLNTKLSFEGVFKEKDFVSVNIAGMIEGNDEKLKNTYLVVTAHYDHLGIGEPIDGDSIYNGVFDNAAGCAALVEIARAFTKYKAPKRSIIFLLVTGEEKGLLGSTYYTDHPLAPLYKTIANVNIDGIAFIDKFKSIIGVGAEYSELKDYLSKTAAKNNLLLTNIPTEFIQTESFNYSDQLSFAKAGVPSILVTDGPDYENISREDGINQLISYSQFYYHTPFDDLNLPINYSAASQHIKLLFDFINDLANSNTSPQWHQGTPFISARLRSIAEKR